MEKAPHVSEMEAKQAEASSLVEFSPEQIRQMLGTSKLSADKLTTVLGFTAQEAELLRSGQAPLTMTPQQYERLKAEAARMYKEGGTKDVIADNQGSVCGSSDSPTPTPTTKPPQQVPSVTGTHSEVTETKAGTEKHSAKVGAGTVKLRTGIEAKVGSKTYNDMFAISYEGKDAKDAHWLQFIWREIIRIKDDGTAVALTDSITTTGGIYKLTPGGTATAPGTPAKENYNTDSANPSDPFYESSGADNRTADSTTLFDMPANAKTKVQAAFAAGAKKVISRAHFTTFLVQKDKVTYKVSLDIEWVFNTDTDDPARTQTPGPAGAATGLPATIRDRFHEQYPAFNFIK